MPLNLSSGGGEFHPYIKYNAKEGRWYIPVDDEPEIEVQVTKLAMDFPSIKVGWMCFPTGQAPKYVWDIGGRRQPQPVPHGHGGPPLPRRQLPQRRHIRGDRLPCRVAERPGQS